MKPSLRPWNLSDTAWISGIDNITIPQSLWPVGLDFSDLTLTVTYQATVLRAAPSMRYPHIPIQLNKDKQISIEKDNQSQGIQIVGPQISAFAKKILNPKKSHSNQTPPGLDPELEEKLYRFENFSPGLAPYY